LLALEAITKFLAALCVALSRTCHGNFDRRIQQYGQVRA